MAIGGAAEAGMTAVGIAAFANMTALSTTGNSRPFDVRRDGFVMTEGAGALVFEDWDRAVARGAHIYGELAGAASTADAHHITAPAPGGSGAAACMQLAMDDAGIGPDQVGHINAHGTSTPLNDQAESDAIGKVFGAGRPRSPRSRGSPGTASGRAAPSRRWPRSSPSHHATHPPDRRLRGARSRDPPRRRGRRTPGPWEPGPVLSNSFGFGGHNGCLVISPA